MIYRVYNLFHINIFKNTLPSEISMDGKQRTNTFKGCFLIES